MWNRASSRRDKWATKRACHVKTSTHKAHKKMWEWTMYTLGILEGVWE